ncbi:poly-gamma-glutamate synthesis protein (capsule biosynthesis protein) [Candidatus Planktophila sulfonica]|uniref:Poly-gamma-glutamate synthesis protein (Capsule biosynthesis protein) n=1 Tax=Candidatus Planktophila sulfonica TaxID=1884904 RepID=A0A249KF52_9ACTN|nr:CapA family protein [Candidatus Planktophila sulfonica]ASY15433.1 poly-gamma-glutamate synthesis protein (capsule biosynthesis protein) [Candidatus Planktophila sulfonica]
MGSKKFNRALFLPLTLSLQIISSPVEASNPQNQPIIINVVGDVHGESAINRKAIPALKKYFADGDLNIFNLETSVTSETKKEEKEYNFKTDVRFLKSLRAVGFNVANVANNHSYDYGLDGFIDTLQNLRSTGFTYVGGGRNSESAYQGRIYTINGIKIALLGLAKVHGGPDSIARKDKAGTTNGYDSASSEAAITRLDKASDVLIVLTHWGEEGTFTPRNYEIASAKKWTSLGADIIVGSHSHTLQPITYVNKKLVAYSLGNFIFYSSHIDNRKTAILKIQINSKKRISYKVKPFIINNLTKVPEIEVSEATV